MSETNETFSVLPTETLKFALLAIRTAADRGSFKIDEFESISNINKVLLQAIENPLSPPPAPSEASTKE